MDLARLRCTGVRLKIVFAVGIFTLVTLGLGGLVTVSPSIFKRGEPLLRTVPLSASVPYESLNFTTEHTSGIEQGFTTCNQTVFRDRQISNRSKTRANKYNRNCDPAANTALQKEHTITSSLRGGHEAKPSRRHRIGFGKSVLSFTNEALKMMRNLSGVGAQRNASSEILLLRKAQQKAQLNNCTTLPQPVISNIKSYLYFIGHACSMHSIVGSILDSHPHIVVSHEFNVIDKLKSLNDKTHLFNGIWNSSCGATTKEGWRNDKADDKGYTLAIHNLYQGAYQSHIDIIGDKRGDMTVKMYMKNPHEFESTLSKLKSIVKIPMKVFHVIRNPYDNIGTLALYDKVLNNVTMIARMKNSDHVQSLDPRIVDSHITTYFKLYQAIEEMKVKYKLDVLEIHGKDLIADPKKVLMKMCDFLQVSCPDDFLNLCVDKIYPKESKTRYKLKWTDYQISAVKTNITKYQNLHRYLDFDS